MKKFAAALLAFSLICSAISIFGVSAETEPVSGSAGKSGSTAASYLEYTEKYRDYDPKDLTVFEGSARVSRGKDFSASVSVENDAWYNLEITYKATENDTGEISFSVLIDGVLPFSQADSFSLPRRYADDGEIRKDGLGNEFTPIQRELYDTQTRRLYCRSTFSTEYSKFFFGRGSREITLGNFGAETVIEKIRLVKPETTENYESVSRGYEDLGEYGGEEINIEGESAKYKSDSDLVSKSDNISSSLYPSDPVIQKLNYIGSNWSQTGEELIWKFNVKESGLYKLSFHYRQSYVLNGNSYRRLKINGETPFSEAGMIPFSYDNGWQTRTFADQDGTPYLIYLEAGECELSLDVTLGPLAEFCTNLEEVVYELGEWYRRIVMITGETPDSNRDYNLFSQIPDMEEGFSDLVTRIERLAEDHERLSGERGGSTVSILNGMKNAIKSMLKYKYKAQIYKSNYYSNYSSVSAVLYELMSMPLDIDTIVLSAPKAEVSKGRVGLFERVGYGIKRFLASFTVDYNDISGGDSEESVVLWINWGRDQAQALNSLIQSDFVPNRNIGVKVKLTNASLVQGILSNNAPDCVLQHARTEPVNLAMRGAAYDLSEFDDYEEIAKRFADGAIVPYQYKGGVYGLPDTQSFMMLFVRTDIFDQMRLEIPNTWDEFISTMKILSGDNLETGVATGFNMFLAQRGGELYNKTLDATDLLTAEAIGAFEFYTDFFTKYGCPKSYNFYNRFRTGLMPMGIQDYTMYATLKATAPEINDRWTMAPVPATVDENGGLNRYSCGTGTACMILNDSKRPGAAWDFIKWWTSAETQLAYVRTVESVLGIAGRVATANVEAASGLAWDGSCLENLKKQWQSVKEYNEIPGSYYTSRIIDQAYWNVVENGEDPKDMLYKWSGAADKEIAKKIRQYEK